MDQPGIVHLGATEGKTLQVLGDRVTIKLRGGETGGAYFLAEDVVPPQRGVPLHSQTTQETFYVLEGEFELNWQVTAESQAESLHLSRGSIVHIPARIFHGYRNTGEAPGRILFIIAPAERTAQFFEELGTALEGQEPPEVGAQAPNPAQLLAILRRYGVTLSPPGQPTP